MEDIFKKSFLEGYQSVEITIKYVFIALLAALALSVYIFLVYKVITRKAFYSQNFNVSLVGICLITTAIIITIQSSVVVSLGMVGALSIVRFRTAIKDPMDLIFLFWAIAVGIICGAGFAVYAALLSIFVTMAIIILNSIPLAKAPMILIVNCTDIDAENKIMDTVKKFCKAYKIKSRNLTPNTLDITVEVRTSAGNEVVRNIIDIDGVTSANLIYHDGEVTF